jgi:5-methylcytosine-specific restriction endonuclease McrA
MPILNWPDWDRYIEDFCRCQYCGLDGTQDIKLYRQMEIDHLIPRPAFDRDNSFNKVVACRACNCMKGTYDPSDGDNTPLTLERRTALIEKAKRYIEGRYTNNWDLDYEEMKQEIKLRVA